MRKIAANLIFPVSSAPIKNGYLIIDDDGTIIDVVDTQGNLQEIAGLEYYSGVLIPGFVNAHCHLELSHLKGKIEQGKGLSKFISQVPRLRFDFDKQQLYEARKALNFMWSRGVNGLGDIMNDDSTIALKQNSKIENFNFVELFNLGAKPQSEIISEGYDLKKQLNTQQLKGSVSPHSMYAVSVTLLNEIIKLGETEIASVHFLEHSDERKLTSDEIKQFLEALAVYGSILLIHNLNLDNQLIEEIKALSIYNKLHWVLCPNSNLYIENRLPDVELFRKHQLSICLGTDSLASNQKLSILDEMKTLVLNFPQIAFSEILTWATLNGAKSLEMDNTLGSFEQGKTPGVLLLSDFDFNKQQIADQTSVKRLV